MKQESVGVIRKNTSVEGRGRGAQIMTDLIKVIDIVLLPMKMSLQLDQSSHA